MWEHKLIDDSNDKIILFGLRKLYLLLIDSFVILVCSYLMGNLWAGLIFNIAYSILRVYAGGFHASSQKKCFVLSYSSIFLCLLFIFYCPIYNMVMHLVCMTLGISIAILSPVDHANKPLYEAEKLAYRKRSHIFILVDTCIYLLFVWNHSITYAKAVLASLVLVGIGQWVAILQKSMKKTLEI